MKIKDLQNHVYPRTIEEIDIPIERAIVQEEFNRRGIVSERTDARERAVDRLIEMEVPFNSEWNTTFQLAKTILKAECPYCHGPMDAFHAGGSNSDTNVDFRCTNDQCGAKATVRIHYDAISMTPPKVNKR